MRKIVFLFLVLSLFACQKLQADKPTETKTNLKKVELRMWLVGAESQAKTINKLARIFTQKTGIKVHCEAISWGQAHSKYLTSIAGDVVPDIGTMGLTWGTEFGSLGAMVDLAKDFQKDLNNIKADVFPGMWKSIEYKNQVFGIPFDLSEHILYYRTDLIKNPPATWQDLQKILQDLAKEKKGMIFDWGTLEWIGFAPFLWQAGGDFYNTDGTKCMLNSPEAQIALVFFSQLYTKYNVPKTKIPVEQGMRTGDFPMAISGNWKILSLTLFAPEIAGRWSIAFLPAGPTGKHTAFIGGRIMGIFKKSKNKREAWEFIKFLFSPEIQNKLYEEAKLEEDSYLPPNIKTWDTLSMEEKFRQVLKNQALDAKGPPSILGWDVSTRLIDEVVQRVVLENKSAKEELSKVTLELDKLIKN
ncbi:MAG: extracellular solute-binding protein [Candidatus Omnitrophota bacterium]